MFPKLNPKQQGFKGKDLLLTDFSNPAIGYPTHYGTLPGTLTIGDGSFNGLPGTILIGYNNQVTYNSSYQTTSSGSIMLGNNLVIANASYAAINNIILSVGTAATNSNTTTISIGSNVYTNGYGNSNGVAIGNNTTCNTSSATAIGYSATTGSNYSGSVALGANASATGSYGLALGSNSTSGSYGTYCIAIGYTATTNYSVSNYSTAIGYTAGANGPYTVSLGAKSYSTLYGQVTLGNTYLNGQSFGSNYYNRTSYITAFNQTTTTTSTKLWLDGTAASQSIAFVPQSINYFKIRLLAKQSSNSNIGVWTCEGALYVGATASTAALQGTPTWTVIGGANLSGVTGPSIAANTTNGGFDISVVGPAATVDWFASIELVELGF